MGRPVITVASGGRPVVDVTSTAPMMGLRVTESTNGFGMPVTKVAAGKFGMPVVYASAISGGGGAPALVPAAWNPADKANINLTNNNLTATSVTSIGGVRVPTGLNAGKYYWEVTVSTWVTNTTGPALSLSSVILTSGAVAGQMFLAKNGTIYINSSSQGALLGARTAGDTIGLAVDLTGKLIWLRVAPAGNWNGSAPANPATATGGLNITSISTGLLFPHFVAGQAGEVATANFGASAFSGAVPSGFTAGWPA